MQGRLYVTQNYLCFYANIFGWETTVTLKWKDVSAVTKEKTARVIPNAVLICTRTEKYFFTSFVARDKTYLMLFRVWQNALMDQPMVPQEMWQWVRWLVCPSLSVLYYQFMKLYWFLCYDVFTFTPPAWSCQRLLIFNINLLRLLRKFAMKTFQYKVSKLTPRSGSE